MNHFNKVCVLGLGYIGLPTASIFADNGLHVYGVDIKSSIVETLNGGDIHIHEPGLHEVFQKVLHAGNLEVGSIPQPADAFIIAVPTPFKEDKKADLLAVKSAAESIVPVLQKGNLVILESTSPPNTTTQIVAPLLEKSGLKAGSDFHLAYSPERVLPGKILEELVRNDRVVGGINYQSAQAARDLYARIVKGNISMTDATTAEMVKLMENTYRDINIAIANEFSRLADRFGVNVWEAIELANKHPRVSILKPGPGVGGHCISVDPWFFVEAAPDITKLIHAARQVNDGQPDFVVDIVERTLGTLQNKRIAVLGLTYKPNVDDIRESPSLKVVNKLLESGADVIAFDPYCSKNQFPNFDVADSIELAFADSDAVVFLVAHQEFFNMTSFFNNYIQFSKPIIFDAVNLLTRNMLSFDDFRVVKIGDNNHHKKGWPNENMG